MPTPKAAPIILSDRQQTVDENRSCIGPLIHTVLSDEYNWSCRRLEVESHLGDFISLLCNAATVSVLPYSTK